MPQTSLISWLKVPPKLIKDDNDSVEPKHALPEAQLRGREPSQNANATEEQVALVHPMQIVRGSQPLAKNASIEKCTQELIPSLKRLNITLFPIPYQDKFYKEIIEDDVTSSITRIALWKPSGESSNSSIHFAQLVGAVRCRLLSEPPYASDDKPPTLYIATLGVLAPFRQHGLATFLLAEIMETAAAEYDVTTTVAHVWEKHEDSLEWYKRRGFRVVGQDEGYYKRLAPHTSAWILRRDLKASDLSPSYGLNILTPRAPLDTGSNT